MKVSDSAIDESISLHGSHTCEAHGEQRSHPFDDGDEDGRGAARRRDQQHGRVRAGDQQRDAHVVHDLQDVRRWTAVKAIDEEDSAIS